MKSVALFCVAMAGILLLGLVALNPALAQDTMQSFSGKVTAVDLAGKAIVIDVGEGKNALVVGAIVTPDTVLMVDGKKRPIADLTKEVKAGDTVALKVQRTTDLYAKEISKK